MGKGVTSAELAARQGIFKREGKLPMLPDKPLKLMAEHFRRVVRRIESIVPSWSKDQNFFEAKDNPSDRDGGIIIRYKGKLFPLYTFPMLICNTVCGTATTALFLTSSPPPGSGEGVVAFNVLTDEPEINENPA